MAYYGIPGFSTYIGTISGVHIILYIYILLLMGMLEYARMLTQTFGFEWHQLMRCFDIGHPVLTMNAQAS